MGIKGRVVAFEAYLDAVPTPKKKGKASTQKFPLRPSAFQPVHKDFAFARRRKRAADSIIRAAKGADKKLITDVRLFDVYRGEGIEPGKRACHYGLPCSQSMQRLPMNSQETVLKKSSLTLANPAVFWG